MKLQLLQGLNVGNVMVFDSKNPHGHDSTMYDLWLAQPAGTVAPINCLKSDRYEPYLVVQHCRELPPCQEQFTGYGKNKISVSAGLVAVKQCFNNLFIYKSLTFLSSMNSGSCIDDARDTSFHKLEVHS